jgi:hypothetical protein
LISILIVEVILESPWDSTLAPSMLPVLIVQLHVHILPCIVRQFFLLLVIKTIALIAVQLWLVLVVTIHGID